MANNSVRTSSELARIAAYALSRNLDDAFIELIARQLVEGSQAIRMERDALIEELAQSLAGSVLSNRRA